MTDRAWHYTVGIGMAGIADSKVLRRSTKDVGPSEKPAVWMTSARFEPTILEARWGSNDGTRTFTPKGPKQFRLSGTGLYRLGLPTSRLLPYRDAIKATKIAYTRRRKLEAISRAHGSELHLWYVSMEDIPLDEPDLSLEYFDGETWVAADPTSAVQLVLDEQDRCFPELQKYLADHGFTR